MSRTSRISVRCTEDQKLALEAQAREADIPFATFLRKKLGLSVWLEQPAQAKERIVKDMEEHAPWAKLDEVAMARIDAKSLEPTEVDLERLEQKTQELERSRLLGPKRAEEEARKILERNEG